jgi:hypothetical protein
LVIDRGKSLFSKPAGRLLYEKAYPPPTGGVFPSFGNALIFLSLHSAAESERTEIGFLACDLSETLAINEISEAILWTSGKNYGAGIK